MALIRSLSRCAELCAIASDLLIASQNIRPASAKCNPLLSLLLTCDLAFFLRTA